MAVLEETIDIAVIGAGHAGCEAALAAARMGLETVVFTVSVDSIAMMPCNPNIGGTSKGHLVKEIDALGGEMGKNIDKTFIQSKMLNQSKGPAVHSLRAQADKRAYSQSMREVLENTDHLTIRQMEIAELIVEDGVLTVAMECAYAPYNWTQNDDSNGAVPISNVSGSYANGYDVMIAKQICEANGWELEIIQTDWGSLVPGVQSGTYDAVIAGQSMTAERSEQVDFAGPYYYASIVCVTKTDSPYANAAGISDLSGGTCTAQIATIWYDSCLPQIEGAQVQTAAETAPAMLMALETDAVDFICTDMPTAMGAVAAYPDMKILDFTDSDDNFEVDEGEINIGISVMKGNTELKEAIDSVLSTMTADDFNTLMNEAIAIQPLSE